MVHQRNLGREERILPHKTLGPVDRIYKPEVLGIFLRATGLLAEKTVLGKRRQDYLADRLLALNVGLGDRRTKSMNG